MQGGNFPSKKTFLGATENFGRKVNKKDKKTWQ